MQLSLSLSLSLSETARCCKARVAQAPPEPASFALFVRRDPPASPSPHSVSPWPSPPRRTHGSARAPRFWKGAPDMSTDTGKVVVNRAMSLDGFIAGPGDTMDWISVFLTADAFAEVMAASCAMLIGRGAYEGA